MHAVELQIELEGLDQPCVQGPRIIGNLLHQTSLTYCAPLALGKTAAVANYLKGIINRSKLSAGGYNIEMNKWYDLALQVVHLFALNHLTFGKSNRE